MLEGFDFGVGMLHAVVARDEAGRRATVNTIGPLWDGNEVWLIVAGAAMFAAFPGWYATMFSAFYLALVLLLVALIVRGVSFEYRGKVASPRWRRTWDGLMTGGSLLAPLLIGVALGDLLHGLPIDTAQEYTGTFWNLLQPYGIFTGITLVPLCVLHGSTFLCLKTTGGLRQQASRLAHRTAPFTAAAVLGFVIWTHVTRARACCPTRWRSPPCSPCLPPPGWPPRTGGLGVRRDHVRHGPHRAVHLHRAVPASDGLQHEPGLQPDDQQRRVRPYSLKVMTIVVVIFLPVVLLYQAWTYYVFRQRISPGDFQMPRLASHASPGSGQAGPAAGGEPSSAPQ